MYVPWGRRRMLNMGKDEVEDLNRGYGNQLGTRGNAGFFKSLRFIPVKLEDLPRFLSDKEGPTAGSDSLIAPSLNAHIPQR